MKWCVESEDVDRMCALICCSAWSLSSMKVLTPQRRIQLMNRSPGLGHEISGDALAGVTLHVDRRKINHCHLESSVTLPPKIPRSFNLAWALITSRQIPPSMLSSLSEVITTSASPIGWTLTHHRTSRESPRVFPTE